MRTSLRYAGVATLVVALAFLAACGEDDKPGAGAPTPTPTATTFEEAEWTITTPVGWTREDATGSADAMKAIRYKDADGNYFIVAIDPAGSDFAADTVWRYVIKGAAFEVVEKTECTGGPEQQCSTNDSRYDGYLLWKSGTTPEKAGGHAWYFIFGNTTTATIDATIFEQIAESIRVKG